MSEPKRLDDLPPDCLKEVFLFVSLDDLYWNVRWVCKGFCIIWKSPIFQDRMVKTVFKKVEQGCIDALVARNDGLDLLRIFKVQNPAQRTTVDCSNMSLPREWRKFYEMPRTFECLSLSKYAEEVNGEYKRTTAPNPIPLMSTAEEFEHYVKRAEGKFLFVLGGGTSKGSKSKDCESGKKLSPKPPRIIICEFKIMNIKEAFKETMDRRVNYQVRNMSPELKAHRTEQEQEIGGEIGDILRMLNDQKGATLSLCFKSRSCFSVKMYHICHKAPEKAKEHFCWYGRQPTIEGKHVTPLSNTYLSILEDIWKLPNGMIRRMHVRYKDYLWQKLVLLFAMTISRWCEENIKMKNSEVCPKLYE